MGFNILSGFWFENRGWGSGVGDWGWKSRRDTIFMRAGAADAAWTTLANLGLRASLGSIRVNLAKSVSPFLVQTNGLIFVNNPDEAMRDEP
jgi:hypothetical protein